MLVYEKTKIDLSQSQAIKKKTRHFLNVQALIRKLLTRTCILCMRSCSKDVQCQQRNDLKGLIFYYRPEKTRSTLLNIPEALLL